MIVSYFKGDVKRDIRQYNINIKAGFLLPYGTKIITKKVKWKTGRLWKMSEITKQEAIELLKQKEIEIEDIFDFVEYLNQVAEDGISYIIAEKNTIITYPTFWAIYENNIFVYYDSVNKKGYIQIGDNVYKFDWNEIYRNTKEGE